MNRTRVIESVAAQVRKSRSLVRLCRRIAQRASPHDVLLLDYPIDPKPRWGRNAPHPDIYDILNRNRSTYVEHLDSFLPFVEYFHRIPATPAQGAASVDPGWNNRWLHALDSVALYGFIAVNRPKYYMEVGSGFSTRFARRAITDHGLATRIISVDPDPRQEIDEICDEVIRCPVEDVNVETFDRLDTGDILFIDGSHRVLMNSDVTALFVDVIPRLRPGVLVQIHDVMLPCDYPESWVERHYSEQYLLAACLLAGAERFEVILPNAFIHADDDLKDVLAPLWKSAQMEDVDTSGSSFWMRIR